VLLCNRKELSEIASLDASLGRREPRPVETHVGGESVRVETGLFESVEELGQLIGANRVLASAIVCLIQGHMRNIYRTWGDDTVGYPAPASGLARKVWREEGPKSD
jgi:hypothetical protein